MTLPGKWSETDSARFIDYGDVFVPRRAEQVQTVVNAIDPLPHAAHVLDLGCGEGVLTRAVLDHFADAQVHALDGSQKMLEAVILTNRSHESRVHPELFSLAERSWRRGREQPVHSVVSSLVIHHLDGPEKLSLFRDMYDLIEPGGALVIADVMRPADDAGRRIAAAAWTASVESAVAGRPDAQEILRVFHDEAWNMYDHLDEDPVDKPSTILEQLGWMREAGFVGVDVLWLMAGHAVLGGKKG